MIDGAIPTTGRRSIHPAWESISRRSPARAAALRVGVARMETETRGNRLASRGNRGTLAHMKPVFGVPVLVLAMVACGPPAPARSPAQRAEDSTGAVTALQ